MKLYYNPAEPPVMRGKAMKEGHDPTGWWVSEKLDGVRGWWTGEQLISRRGNVFAAPDWFTEGWPSDVVLDGEIFGGRGNFNETSGIVRRAQPHQGWKKLVYFVFDLPEHGGTYEERMEALEKLVEKVDSPYLAVVPRMKLESADQLDNALAVIQEAGGEGMMIVSPGSRYVADKTSAVLKVKSWHDAEGTVYDYEPGKGSNKGVMGALWVRDAQGHEYKVGGGFTRAQRARAKELYPIGTVITYKFTERFPSGKPRFPIFMRVRSEEPVARQNPRLKAALMRG